MGYSMQDLYRGVLEGVRSPGRVDAFMRLVDILSDVNYADDLTRINDFIALGNNLDDTAYRVESFLCDCTNSLLTRLGLSISAENINRVPKLAADIIDTLLVSIDAFDDYDTMLQIMQHENNPVEAIGCLVGFVESEQEHKYIEIIDTVTSSAIETIKKSLMSRALVDIDANTANDLGIVKQLKLFIDTYPESPVTPLLIENGYLSNESIIADKVDLSQSTHPVRDYATCATGILFTRHLTYDTAYEKLEALVEYIIGDDVSINPSQIMVNASNMLSDLYKQLEGSDE